MRQASGALGVAIAAGSGCGALCDGPGCESSFPAARLALIRGLPDPADADVTEDADARLDGTLEAGSSWTADAWRSRVVIGQPDASSVVRVADRSGVGRVDPDATWSAAGTEFGTSVLVLPAVDGGDAFDLWVGAPGEDYGKGAVYLFRDADADQGKGGVADLSLTSASPNDRFGTHIERCADFTGDRLPEILVTAPWFEAPDDWTFSDPKAFPVLSGAVFLLFSEELVGPRDPATRPWDLGRVWWGAESGEGAGHAVACDQDLDGDGVADVVIGAPWADRSRGRIYALLEAETLPASGPLDGEAWRTIEGPESGEWFGAALSAPNVGGESMLAVGAAGYSGGGGRVHLFAGSALSASSPSPRAMFYPPAGRDLPDHFGRWLAAGDLDNDQQDDLVVGAPDFHGEGRDAFDTGQLWIWLGAGGDGWDLRTAAEDADASVAGSAPFQRVGRAMAVVDVDADGVDDLLLPTRAADPTER